MKPRKTANGVPAAAAPGPEQQQEAFDLEDAMHRFRKLHLAIQKRDQAEEKVRSLQRQLQSARRQLQEANWDLTALLHAERRKGGEA